ncbi:hypothetical protein [Endozoicomonas sp. 8E]|uniref:hypothetical protein n=1 Tax=Endozoicomonas sp. 8E TaxID=3035692 RepID=UPI0029391BDB|nr:hypothetical protein [Endozoicomonas sp. 8E]WOG29064.1 hypothetical protein P6910_05210 [Endozoicomonas sp. 8E]
MSKQNANQTFTITFFTILLWLFSLNAYPVGLAEIEFLQGAGADTFTVTTGLPRECIDHVSPWTLQTTPGNGQTMRIYYLQGAGFCDVDPSIQLFEVKSNQHSDKVAQFKWLKDAGEDPTLVEIYDPDRLLTVDAGDVYHIKVWASYGGQPH